MSTGQVTHGEPTYERKPVRARVLVTLAVRHPMAALALACALLAASCGSGGSPSAPSTTGNTTPTTTVSTTTLTLPPGVPTDVAGAALTSHGSTVVALTPSALTSPLRSANVGGPASLVEVQPNGSLDPTFGARGVATLSIAMRSNSTMYPGTVAIDGAGRIWALGIAVSRGLLAGAVERLTPGGAPDPSFGENGVSTFPFPIVAGVGPYDATFDGAGGLYVTGQEGGDYPAALAVVGLVDHLGADGTVDRGFASPRGALNGPSGAMARPAGGSRDIVVVGNNGGAHPATGVDIYNPSGHQVGTSVRLTPDPGVRVTAVGQAGAGGEDLLVTTATAVGRFLANGTLDPTWDEGCGQLLPLVDPVILANGGLATVNTDAGRAVLIIRDADGRPDDRVAPGGAIVTGASTPVSTQLVVASTPGFVVLVTSTPGQGGLTVSRAALPTNGDDGSTKGVVTGTDTLSTCAPTAPTTIVPTTLAPGLTTTSAPPEGTPINQTAGSTATVTLPTGLPPDLGGVAVTPQGSILAVFTAPDADPPAAIVKIRPDGSLDPTFGSGGVAPLALRFIHSATFPGTILTDDLGRIWVLGLSLDVLHSSAEAAVERLTSNGSPDVGFGTRGVATFPLPQGTGGGSALQGATSDGAGGLYLTNLVSDFDHNFSENLVHLRADGTEDPKLGRGGRFAIPQGAITLQADGDIAVVGQLGGGAADPSPTVLEMYDPAGQQIGRSVVLTPDPPGTASYVVQQAGGYLVATDRAVGRFLPNGSLDPSWDGGCDRLLPLVDPVILADGGIATATVAAGRAVLMLRNEDGKPDDRVASGGTVITSASAIPSTQLIVASSAGFVGLITRGLTTLGRLATTVTVIPLPRPGSQSARAGSCQS